MIRVKRREGLCEYAAHTHDSVWDAVVVITPSLTYHVSITQGTSELNYLVSADMFVVGPDAERMQPIILAIMLFFWMHDK